MVEDTKILIVDDDDEILASLKDILEDNGFTVITAHNGKEGIKKYESEKPRLIITDITMPDMEGIELIRTLSKKGDKVPIIVMSGHVVGRQFLQAALRFGAVDKLTKPFTIKQLLEKVNRFLSV